MSTNPHALSKAFQKILTELKKKEIKKSNSLKFDYSNNRTKSNDSINKYFPSSIPKSQNLNINLKKEFLQKKINYNSSNNKKEIINKVDIFQKNNKNKLTNNNNKHEIKITSKSEKLIEINKKIKESLEKITKNRMNKNQEINKTNNQAKENNKKKIDYLEILQLNKEINERNKKEIKREEEAKRKNERLEILLVGEKKRNFSIPKNNKNQNENNIKKKNELFQNLNVHINPLRKSTNNIKYYKCFKYTENEIFEKILDFDFYENKQSSEEIPNTFESEIHYKYIWIKNFFNELRNLLLRDKSETSEIENYLKIDVEVSFSFINESDSNITLFKISPNKKLSDYKIKILKDNDIIAFYPNNEKINFNNINFKNSNKENYFIGLIQLNNESFEINCFIHNKYIKKFHLINFVNDNIKEIKLYKTYYLGNLTSPLREYKAILNLELSNFTGILYSKDLFLEKEKNNNLTLKSRLFLENIKKKKIFNISQTEAIIKASEMKNKDILLIQGPPGTGKTHTILGLISLFLLNNNGKILICAPSNTAIDEISARIANIGLLNENLERIKKNFIRFGIYDRKEKENKYLYTSNGKIIQNYSLEKLSDKKYKNLNNEYNSSLELVNKEIEKYMKIIKKEKSKKNEFLENKLSELKTKRYFLIHQLTDLKNERKKFEYDLISNTRILCTTLNSSGSDKLKKMHINFDYLIIDEACQCIEPSNLIPLYHKIKQLIMVGDHMQLPATVFTENASKINFNRSLFERLIDNNYPKYTLNIQYRMHFNIRKFIGDTFYNGVLKDDSLLFNLMKNHFIFQFINENKNFSFFDISYGKEFFEGKSYFNLSEVDFVLKIIKQIDNLIKKKNNSENYFDGNNNEIKLKYAIITPYKSQVKFFIEKLNEIRFKLSKNIDIEINTVDSFQGQERDIVFFSTVRSNFSYDDEEYNKNHYGIGFLNDFRRMNVALSRAKFACFVIGNSDTLKNNSYWKKLIDFCIEKQSFFFINSFHDSWKFKSYVLNSIEKPDFEEIEDGEVVEVNYSNYIKEDNNILGNKRERDFSD